MNKNKNQYKRRDIKRKNLITKEKYPMAISWDVDESDFDKSIRSGQFQIYPFGNYGQISLYGNEEKNGTKDIEILIKELTNFVNTIKKGK